MVGGLHLKRSTKTATIIAVAICVVCGSVVAAYSLQQTQKQPELRVYMIAPPTDSTISSVQRPVIPVNEAYVIAEAEQASITKNSRTVNVTMIQTQNSAQATSLFEIIKATYIAQGFASYNLTSPYPAVQLTSTERPTTILLLKEDYVALCQSDDVNLALEATNAQLNK
jgi:hypothetical protein